MTTKPLAPKTASATKAAPAAKAAPPKPSAPLTLESVGRLLKRKQIQVTPGPDTDLYDALLLMRDEIERLQRNVRDVEVKLQRLSRQSREHR